MKPRSRKRLRKSVHKSYLFVERILKKRFRHDTFVTSVWAILEALGNLRRSRIQFNMLTQNISIGYYDIFKDKRGFALDAFQIRELNRLVAKLEHGSLEWSDLAIEFHWMLRFLLVGLDSTDAVHVAIATSEKCETLVTRDRDFLDRRKVLSRWLDVISPTVAIQRLTERRRRKPESVFKALEAGKITSGPMPH